MNQVVFVGIGNHSGVLKFSGHLQGDVPAVAGIQPVLIKNDVPMGDLVVVIVGILGDGD